MDNRLQATFMPRQAPGGNGEYVRPKGPPNFLMIIAFIAILLVGGAWGGLYFYEGVVTKSNETKKAQIQEEINNFDPELTKQLSVLKARLDAGKKLIAGHNSFSKFLELLSANTVQTVQFTSLAYSAADDEKITFNLKGQSNSYNAIAYQSDVFSRVPDIKAPVFSSLSLNQSGIISFNVDAGLDASAIKYVNQFQNEVVTPAPITSPPPITPVTSFSTTTRATSTPATTGGTTTPASVGSGT